MRFHMTICLWSVGVSSAGQSTEMDVAHDEYVTPVTVMYNSAHTSLHLKIVNSVIEDKKEGNHAVTGYYESG
jgi:hypothetical protein